jgi:hypothetical protein
LADNCRDVTAEAVAADKMVGIVGVPLPAEPPAEPDEPAE